MNKRTFLLIVLLTLLSACAHKMQQSPDVLGEVLPFRGQGNEPGWSVTVTAEQIELTTNYGQKTLSTPRSSPVATELGYRYTLRPDGHTLVIEIAEQLCRDDMSGMSHPYRVTMTLDGTRQNGCGGSPLDLLIGDEWLVEDLDNKGLIDFSRATLNFSGDQRLWGRASCNQYTTSFALGEGLTIQRAALTRMACSPAIMDQEALFMRLLEAVVSFDFLPDGALQLRTANGETITARR